MTKMDYLDYSVDIYDKLIKSDSCKIGPSADLKYESLLNSISTKVTALKLKNQYIKETRSLVKRHVSFMGKSINEIQDATVYATSVGLHTSFFIFWALHNKLKISGEQLKELYESVFIGTLGYRLLDVNLDEKHVGREYIIIGKYLVRICEEKLLKTFTGIPTLDIINKYARYYTEAEYLEKSSKWKSTPFSWNEPEKLGYKSAPLLMIAEILFRISGLDEQKINSRLKGFLYFAAALQMTDDISDALEDLNNGTETLVMSGFYEEFGDKVNVTAKHVETFLTHERILKFYDVTQLLFNKAREIFTEEEDDIYLLLTEILNYGFTSEFFPKV